MNKILLLISASFLFDVVAQPVQTKCQLTSLHAIAADGKISELRSFIENAVDINAQTSTGATPLFLAAQNGHTACVKMLLEHGADAMTQTKKQETALHVAVQNGHVECAEILLKNDAKISAQAEEKITIDIPRENDGLKEKATFNLSLDILKALEKSWMQLRSKLKGEQRITKTLIVEKAIEIALADLEIKSEMSDLFLRLRD